MSLSLWVVKGAAALVPAALLLLYFHERTGARTPARVIAAALVLGFAAAFAALGLQQLLSVSRQVSFAWIYDLPLVETLGGSGHHMVRAFVYGGAVEEGVKFLGVCGLLALFRERVSPAVAVMIAVGVAAAFAGLENVLYVVTRGDWAWIAFFRAFLSIPAHIFLGAILAFFLVLARRGGAWRCAIILAFLVPALLHGMGNYLIALGSSEVAMPRPWKNAATLIYAAQLAAEAVTAVMVARCAARLDVAIGPGTTAAARLWGGQLGMRRFFWSVCSLALALLGPVHVVFITARQGNAELILGTPLVISVLSLLFAVLFWLHGRPP